MFFIISEIKYFLPYVVTIVRGKVVETVKIHLLLKYNFMNILAVLRRIHLAIEFDKFKSTLQTYQN